jgi:hypothetical protein
MIRTVWLAIICLALVSALAAGKALKIPADPTVAELSVGQTTVGIAQPQDTLNKADRLEINYVHHEISSPPFLQSLEPVVPAVTPPSAADGNQNHKPALARSKCLFVFAQRFPTDRIQKEKQKR